MKVFARISWCLLTLFILFSNFSDARAANIKVLEVLNCYSLMVQTDAGPLVVRIAEVISPRDVLIGLVDAEEAKAFLKRLTAGVDLTLDYWVTDLAGRLICQVFLPDGRSLGEIMVAKGFLLPDPFYSFNAKLTQLEDVARSGKVGVWKRNVVYKTFD